MITVLNKDTWNYIKAQGDGLYYLLGDGNIIYYPWYMLYRDEVICKLYIKQRTC